jgi:F-type H+-transporting ATPase subunit alpha
LRRPPGREAYPGDIFYLHSKLLERSGSFDKSIGGGSITALPIIETQANDISAYIPTNLISITDGQLFMNTELFNAGQRPAIDIGLSVSRVGSSAQKNAIKKVSSSLKLELSQYSELLAFTQFGAEIDDATQLIINRGKKNEKIICQTKNTPYTYTNEVFILFCIKNNFFDNVRLDKINDFIAVLLNFVNSSKSYKTFSKELTLTDSIVADFKKIIESFITNHSEFCESNKEYGNA